MDGTKRRRVHKKKTKEIETNQVDSTTRTTKTVSTPVQHDKTIGKSYSHRDMTTRNSPPSRKSENTDIVICADSVAAMMVASPPSPTKKTIAEKLNNNFCESLEIVREKSTAETNHVSIISSSPCSKQGNQQQQQQNILSKTASRILSCLTPSPAAKNATAARTPEKNSRKRLLSQPSCSDIKDDFVGAKKKLKNVTSLGDGDDDCTDIIEIKYVSCNPDKQQQEQQQDTLLDNNNKKRNFKETKLTQFYSGVRGASSTTGVSEKARRKRALGLTKVVKTNHKISDWLNLQQKPQVEITPRKSQTTPDDKMGVLLSRLSPPLSSSQSRSMITSPPSSSSSMFMSSSYTALSSLLKGRPGIRQAGNIPLRTTESTDSQCSWWQQKDVPTTPNHSNLR